MVVVVVVVLKLLRRHPRLCNVSCCLMLVGGRCLGRGWEVEEEVGGGRWVGGSQILQVLGKVS